tara:strand:+ start:421 stop:699 length:279 start_codon:yes stop_codon:yes gene_type:complete
MKDTIKNSIIGAFAIFGLVALISSSNSAPTVIQDGTPESHVWTMVSGGGTSTVEGRVYLYNKVTGEVRKYSRKGMYSGKLKDQYYQVMHADN